MSQVTPERVLTCMNLAEKLPKPEAFSLRPRNSLRELGLVLSRCSARGVVVEQVDLTSTIVSEEPATVVSAASFEMSHTFRYFVRLILAQRLGKASIY